MKKNIACYYSFDVNEKLEDWAQENGMLNHPAVQNRLLGLNASLPSSSSQSQNNRQLTSSNDKVLYVRDKVHLICNTCGQHFSRKVKRDMLSVVNRKLYNVSVPSVGKFSPEKTIYCDIKEIATLATSKPPQHAQHILLIKNKVSYLNNIYNMQSFLNIFNKKRNHKPLNPVSEYSIDVHSNLILFDLNHTTTAY